MPNYSEPFGQFGAAAGGTAGGLLGNVGRLLEPLDWARQSLWNLPGKLASGDFAAALPGLLGAGAAIATAPFGGLPLAALAGSLAGGIGQGIGKSVDEERFAAPTGEDAVKALGGDTDSLPGAAGSFLLSALGDPLSYAGMGGGARLGRRAGEAAGRSLEEGAIARGVNYPGGAAKLPGESAFATATPPHESFADPRYLQWRQNLLSSPHAEDVLREIPPNPVGVGGGIDAKALLYDDGRVVRIGGGPGTIDTRRLAEQFAEDRGAREALPTAPAPRPDLPELIPAARSRAIGPYRVEHVPRVQTLPKYAEEPANMEAARMQLINQLEDRGLAARHGTLGENRSAGVPGPPGMEYGDFHGGNGGIDPRTGNYVAFDPGISPNAPPGIEEAVGSQPGRIKSFLLNLLGSDAAVRREVEDRLATVGLGHGVPLPQEASLAGHFPELSTGPPAPSLPGTNAAGPAARRRAAPVPEDVLNLSSHSSDRAFAAQGEAPGIFRESGVFRGLRPGEDPQQWFAMMMAERDAIPPDPILRQGIPTESQLARIRDEAMAARVGEDVSLSALQRELLGGAPAAGPTDSQTNRLLRRQLERPSRETDLLPRRATDLERLGASPSAGSEINLGNIPPDVQEAADALLNPQVSSSPIPPFLNASGLEDLASLQQRAREQARDFERRFPSLGPATLPPGYVRPQEIASAINRPYVPRGGPRTEPGVEEMTTDVLRRLLGAFRGGT